MVRFTVISDELETSKHLTNSKETQDFREDDTSSRKLLSIDISDCVEVGSGIEGAKVVGECSGVAEVA